METGDPVQIGDVVAGRYRVERVLGRGAMGMVVLGADVASGVRRAIKLLPVSAHASDTMVERFFREARAMARLKSEHAARVFEADILPSGAPYMVLEHLEGEDLGDMLKRRGALPPHEAADYVQQAAEALAEAHSLGIVHRDLKPGNLFAKPQPDGSICIKVLDFGLAKALYPEEDASDLTLTNTVLGSPSYMSPEQLRSSKDVDPRTDIWSLGVVLYQLVTGRLPFHGKTAADLVGQILVDTPVKPSTLRPGLPHAFDGVIARCLEKSPAARFSSMEELRAALSAFLPPRPATPAPPPPPPPPPRPVVPWLWIIAVTAFLASIVVLLLALLMLRR